MKIYNDFLKGGKIMKKIKWLVVILMISLLFGIIACKHSTNAPKAPDSHHHTFATEWTSDASGHWHAATCGHTTEVSGKAAHTFGDWTTTKEATCTQEGKKTVYCTVCLYEKEETIPAKEHSGIWEITEEPTKTEIGKMQTVCKVCGETVTKELQPVPERFVLVEAGTFQMGSNVGYYDNKPAHEVTITKPFYMGKYEVTQAEYEKYCSYTGSYSPSSTRGDGDNYPAYYVSWYDALVYCNKRSIAEGLTPCYSINDSTNPDVWGEAPDDRRWNHAKCRTWNAATCDFEANGYRLPTEAEWEWLARGGENYEYAGSDNADDVAWYHSKTYNTGTREVKTKAPNGYGLYDMSGNVWEWCWDWYGSIRDSTPADGISASDIERVVRGGSWHYYYYDDAYNCRVTYRDDFAPELSGYDLGFRVVRQAN